MTPPDNGLQLSSIRQRIESVFQTCNGILTSSAMARAPSGGDPEGRGQAAEAGCFPARRCHAETPLTYELELTRATKNW